MRRPEQMGYLMLYHGQQRRVPGPVSFCGPAFHIIDYYVAVVWMAGPGQVVFCLSIRYQIALVAACRIRKDDPDFTPRG
jgi:hypothetical protein